jgi:glycosyltransferase involved in cell wall biosynthesis
MIDNEGVSPEKIYPIRLGYDFSSFGEIVHRKVGALKERLKGSVCLITVGRLDNFKRPEISLELLAKLKSGGVKTHLFFLGSGEKLDSLKAKAGELGLTECVEFLGYADDVLTYLKACDWLIHPSISESSCVVVKEAGIVGLPAIVCRGVGDFDEYLLHGKNSFLVDQERFVNEAAEIIRSFVSNDMDKESIGKSLNKEITDRFHISSVIEKYKIFNGD